MRAYIKGDRILYGCSGRRINKYSRENERNRKNKEIRNVCAEVLQTELKVQHKHFRYCLKNEIVVFRKILKQV